MFQDVEQKLKKKNKILFTRNSTCLQELIALIQKQSHKTLVIWAFQCVEIPLKILQNHYPEEQRAKRAVELCKQWAQGDIKMPIAKRAILDCHAACKEMTNEVDIALCHAIGQGISTVHVETHALGLPFYELTALVLEDKENYQERVWEKIKWYLDTLTTIANQAKTDNEKWASFLKDETVPNKEKKLQEKREITNK